MIPTDVAPQGSDLGGAFVIFAALVAVAGVIWLAGWIRGERQRRRDQTAFEAEHHRQFIDWLTVSLAMAYSAEDHEKIQALTNELKSYGFTVTYDTETLSLRVTGPAA